MAEALKGIIFLGISGLCVYLLRSPRARAFIRKVHPPSQTEVGLLGWFLILLILGMASFLAGVALIVHSIVQLLK